MKDRDAHQVEGRGRPAPGVTVAVFAAVLAMSSASAAELKLRIDHPPTNGTVVALLFNSASAFADLRDPFTVRTLSSEGSRCEGIANLPAGEYALVVYQDANGNGRLDKNFIGIPREPLGFSNRYWPQGPPTYARAAFRLEERETKAFEVELQSVFGAVGLFGLGVGVLARTSPYRGAERALVQPIPAISYIGDRVQILGPAAQCGLAKWGDIGLAATVSYRLGAYEEDDSSYLQDLGNREDTLMGGLALQAELAGGFELSAGYEHDTLNRVGGGSGRIGLERGFQSGQVTVSPQLSLNWLSAALADYEFGVPADRAVAGRPAYAPGAAVSVEVGVGLVVELPGSWRIILKVSDTLLPSELTASPIVDQSQVVGGFAALTRLF